MPPMVVAAGVTAAASLGGAVLSKNATNSAAKSASATAQNTATANNALALNIYGQNKGLLSPYSERGNAAGTAINALLGLGGQPQQPAQQAPQSFAPPMNALAAPYGGGGGRFQAPDAGMSPEMYMGPGMSAAPVNNMQYGPPSQVGAAQPPVAPEAAPGASPYASAFNDFLGSTGMRFQMDEGNRAINTGYAARGTLQSGAAMKALQDRGQQTALNNYFMPYMGLLQGQQGVGMGAASAVAGVGQNYANSVMANNNLAGDAAMNAALARGASNSSMYMGIGNALGTAAGSIFGSSYRRPGT